MSDSEQAAVEALCNLTMQEGDNSPFALHTWKGDERATAARAIFAAIRSGQVPGVLHADEISSVQLVVDLRAEVERKGELAHLMEQARDRQIDRAAKATAERDRLAALLRECRNDMINGLTLGEAADLEHRIYAALAEVGK